MIFTNRFVFLSGTFVHFKILITGYGRFYWEQIGQRDTVIPVYSFL